jgi:putative ABC transport system permease protein
MPEGQSKMVTAVPVEKDYLKTFGMQLVAGTDFTEADVQESLKPQKEAFFGYILNEAAVKELGWTPQEAVGRKVHLNIDGVVRGVVKDFHFASMRKEISPLVIFMEPFWGGQMMVKVAGDDLPGTLAFIESKWKVLAPHRPFTYQFLDDAFNGLYGASSGWARCSACLPSWRSSWPAWAVRPGRLHHRADAPREIGIRKVLGASVDEHRGAALEGFPQTGGHWLPAGRAAGLVRHAQVAGGLRVPRGTGLVALCPGRGPGRPHRPAHRQLPGRESSPVRPGEVAEESNK